MFARVQEGASPTHLVCAALTLFCPQSAMYASAWSRLRVTSLTPGPEFVLIVDTCWRRWHSDSEKEKLLPNACIRRTPEHAA